jgi:hypothetical protein
VSSNDPAPAAPGGRKSARRLRPEVAAELAARNRQSRLDALYEKPVEELDPEEIARMRSAFFRG